MQGRKGLYPKQGYAGNAGKTIPHSECCLAPSAPTSASGTWRNARRRRTCLFAGEKLEAAIGVEPMMEVLQSSLARGPLGPGKRILQSTSVFGTLHDTRSCRYAGTSSRRACQQARIAEVE